MSHLESQLISLMSFGESSALLLWFQKIFSSQAVSRLRVFQWVVGLVSALFLLLSPPLSLHWHSKEETFFPFISTKQRNVLEEETNDREENPKLWKFPLQPRFILSLTAESEPKNYCLQLTNGTRMKLTLCVLAVDCMFYISLTTRVQSWLFVITF